MEKKPRNLDWLADPDRQEMAFDLIDRLTFDASSESGDIVIGSNVDPIAKNWLDPSAGQWCDFGYIVEKPKK